ncbi:hypothetical protein BJ165DRAFT_1610537 [Panaeolus papilionaceus]|nr:hypothetical protein BJ165DRAFT_1610537 [Panaeolus papilionaceus]
MLVEMVFEDISFWVFPKLDGTLWHVLDLFYSNSLEDILYMVMEALEGVAYLHEHRIAHQDLFAYNFLVQWQPESMIKRATARPRVWIIDFEDSVMFPEDIDQADMKVEKFPQVLEDCTHPLTPEVFKPDPYCPFKLDVWQFAQELKAFDYGFDEVTQIFNDVSKEIPEERITALAALHRLDSFVQS